MSMRLEKGWGVWTLEFRPDFDAVESGMDVFINWKKDFVGKEVTQTIRDAGPKQKLVTMTIEVDGIDVSNDEAILKNGEAVGYISSVENAAPGTSLQVEILGEFYDAEVLGGPIYDPNGANMRC